MGAAAWKIPDPKGSFKTTARPFDCFGFYKGRGFAIEAKSLKRYDAFGPNRLSDGQIKNLNRAHRAGALTFVVLFVFSHNQWRLMVFPWPEFSCRTKSIPKATMLALPYYTMKDGVYPTHWLTGVGIDG